MTGSKTHDQNDHAAHIEQWAHKALECLHDFMQQSSQTTQKTNKRTNQQQQHEEQEHLQRQQT